MNRADDRKRTGNSKVIQYEYIVEQTYTQFRLLNFMYSCLLVVFRRV